MSFSSLFGIDPAIAALQRALRNEQVAGTYLFVGPQGVGKTSLALALAQAAACLSPTIAPCDACGVCDSCLRAIAGQHPEINLISPAGDQTQIWQFWDRDNKPRGILQHTLPFSPVIGARRVYILERADTLTEAAANSLLKVLEEPPPYVLFILLAPHSARMLPTILSRSQLIRLNSAPVPELTAYLQATASVDPERARTYAAYAEGRTGTALRLARNSAIQEEIDRAVELAAGLASAPALRALRLAEGMRKLASSLKAHTDSEPVAPDPTPVGSSGDEESGEPASKEKVGRRQLGMVLELLSACYRDLLALRLGGEHAPIIHGDRRAELAKIAASRSTESWMQCLETLLQARRRVDQNASIPLLTDWLAMRLVHA
jgi:DNA polymerase III subunit delta'